MDSDLNLVVRSIFGDNTGNTFMDQSQSAKSREQLDIVGKTKPQTDMVWESETFTDSGSNFQNNFKSITLDKQLVPIQSSGVEQLMKRVEEVASLMEKDTGSRQNVKDYVGKMFNILTGVSSIY